MNERQLLVHFDRVSEAPDAVARLRRFVLELAVRGRLVEQVQGDEPAWELLKRIDAVRARLPRGGRARSLTPLNGEGVPFSLPKSWRWARLADVTSYIQRGKSPKYASDRGLPVVSQKCVQWRGLDLSPARLITEESIVSYEEVRFLRSGDLLWNSTGTGTIGRVIRVKSPPPQLVCDSHVTVLRCLEVDPEYVRTWLRSDHVFAKIEERASGATNQVELTAQMAAEQQVPLPPVAEQRRIVAKVDELMWLCDRLETAMVEREERRDRLSAASLHRLSIIDGDNQSEFGDRARFYLQTLARMMTRPDQVKEHREAILDLAVRGRLVPQDEWRRDVQAQLAVNDEVRCSTAKSDRRADAELQHTLTPAMRWLIPSPWEWRCLADVVLFIDYRGKTPTKTDHGVRLVTAKNVRKGFISETPAEFIADSDYASWMTRGLPRQGDVLFTTEAPMGNAAVVRLTERFALAQRTICFRGYGGVDADFLALQLNARPFQAILEETATGLTAKGIKASKLKRLPVAVPPLEEQRSIVVRVNELMAVCDCLETQIAIGNAERGRLLEAVLHQALQPGTAPHGDAKAGDEPINSLSSRSVQSTPA